MLMVSITRKRKAIVIASIAAIILGGIAAAAIYMNQSDALFVNRDAVGGFAGVPTNLRVRGLWNAAAKKGTSVLTWDPVDGAASYTIYQYDVAIGTVNAPTTTFTIPLDKVNAEMTSAVTATNAEGKEGIPSNIVLNIVAVDPNNPPIWAVDGAPDAPTSLAAVPEWNLGKPRIHLTWLGSMDNLTYTVYRDGTKVAEGLWGLNYFDNAVSAGETHTYEVTSTKNYWPTLPESAHSTPVTATALTGEPTLRSQLLNMRGLSTTYFSDNSLTTPLVSRLEQIPPSYRISANGSLRMTGALIPKVSGTHTFYTQTDIDGIRLWINDQKIIDTWAKPVNTETASSTIDLTANQPVSIKLEMMNPFILSALKLSWSAPTLAKEAVPASSMRPIHPNDQVSTKVTITGVQRNDDSVMVYFDPVFGAADYRLYKNGAMVASAKYAGASTWRSNMDLGPGVPGPTRYGIEMNGINITDGDDLVVEAVDKVGPFQKMDGTMGPGSTTHTHQTLDTNGQGDPSNVPIALARSDVIHVTAKARSLTGAQAFFDRFRDTNTWNNIPVSDPAILDYYVKNQTKDMISEYENPNWTIRQYTTDQDASRMFTSGSHFMDTAYDGPSPLRASFGHNNNSSTVILPKQTADISGDKILHVTMEVDGHSNARRWNDIFIGGAGDPLLRADPTKLDGNKPTVGGSLFTWEIFHNLHDLSLFVPQTQPDGSVTKSTQVNLTQTADNNDQLTTSREFFDHATPMANGSTLEIDRRHRYDLYLSKTKYKIVETMPDGKFNVVREKNFPAGMSLPWDKVQVYYVHEIYHSGLDRQENMDPLKKGANSYWYNYRPFADERHWDNMGFEVLSSWSEANPVVLPIEAPVYVQDATTSLCIQSNLANRTTANTHDSVKVDLTDTAGNVQATTTAQMSAEGRISVTDTNFVSMLALGTHGLKIKPRGYLSQQIKDVAGMPGQCLSLPPFTPGDFSPEDDKVSLSDIVTAIRQYNGQPSVSSTYAYPAGTPLNLAKMVDLIRTYNTLK